MGLIPITTVSKAEDILYATFCRAFCRSPPKETPSKLKALHETILRMNEKNLTLTTESKTLKQDLQKLMDDRDAVKEKES